MARPKGSKNKAPTSNGEVGTDHNKATGKPAREPLTDEQEQALVAHHTKAYIASLAEKKKADAAFKNTCKIAKAEGVSLSDIKDTIDLESEEGQERLRKEIARKHRIARWAGLPVGAQPSFFDDEDRTPSVDRAQHDGKRAALKGQSCNAPHHLGPAQSQAWIEGWHAGQAVLGARFKETADAEA